ncbi:MAG: rhomboid family intramembrane serine protease, partial [Planctomycetota bacterium]
MFFPIGLSVSLARFPWANFILILVITTVSILAWIDQDLMIQLSGATVVGSGPFEVWAFHRPVASWPDYAVSASFLHADVLHLLGNMLFLYLFGTAMNAKLGHIRYLLLYFASAIFSGCLFYATSDGAAVGASGAIMGVVGAFAVMYPLNEVRVFYWVTYFLTGTFEISAYWV